MRAVPWLLLGFLGAASAAAALSFNHMVRLRNRVRRAWQDIDVQLELRHRLLPLLASAARGYAEREAALLEEATRARSGIRDAGPAYRARSESGLDAAAREALSLVERYPDLKADASFSRLVEELVRVEDHLASARKYYNGAVRQYNTFIQAFPFNLLAGTLHFRPAEYFELPREGVGEEKR